MLGLRALYHVQKFMIYLGRHDGGGRGFVLWLVDELHLLDPFRL